MRFSRGFASIFSLWALLLATASAEIKIKVVDPSDAAVAGALVQLLQVGKAALAGAQSTSAEGLVVFRVTASSSYRVQVLAPGFAVELTDLASTTEMTTVKLRVATAAETVVVTATRTPVPSQAA